MPQETGSPPRPKSKGDLSKSEMTETKKEHQSHLDASAQSRQTQRPYLGHHSPKKKFITTLMGNHGSASNGPKSELARPASARVVD